MASPAPGKRTLDIDSDNIASRDSKRIRLSAPPSPHAASTARDKKRRRKKSRTVPVTQSPKPVSSTKSRHPPISLAFSSASSTFSSSSTHDRDSHESLTPVSSNSLQSSHISTNNEAQPTLEVESSALQEEIDRIKKELETKNKLIEAHQSNVSQFQQSLTCQICLELLSRPYAVVPCGHVSCFSCLERWFTTTHAGEPVPVHHRIVHPKTCPHCRAKVSQRPIEIWDIKNMASTLARSGLAVDLIEPTGSAATDTPAHADPWNGIFPSLANITTRRGDGLIDDIGIRDEEDDVFRCLDCNHEIMDGICTGCQRVYHGLLPDSDLDDEDDGGFGWGGLVPGGWIGFPWGAEDLDDEDSEGFSVDGGEVEEEGYESSFIEDEDDVDGHQEDDHVDLDGQSDPEDASEAGRLTLDLTTDEDDYIPPPVPYAGNARPSVGPRTNSRRVLSDSEDETEDEGEATDASEHPVGRSARRAPMVVDITSDEDEDETHGDRSA